MKTKSTFSNPEMLKRATETISRREQLEGLLREAEAQLPILETRLQAARIQLADQETKVALGSAESSKEQLAELNTLLLEREAARARVSGIQQRLADQEPELGTVAAELAAAHRDWSKGVWRDFIRQDYAAALKAFQEVLSRGRAVALGLGVSATLPGPGDFADLPDVTAAAEYYQPLQTLNTLRRFSNQATSRREFEKHQRAYHVPVFDPGGVYVALRDMTISGRVVKTGDRLDARMVRLDSLERLHRIHRVKLIPTSDYVATGG